MKKRSTVGAKSQRAVLKDGVRPRHGSRHAAKKAVMTPAPCRPAVEIITPKPPGGFEGSEPAVPTGLRRVRFSYFEPEAQEIFLVGSFNDWNPRATPMARIAPGEWSVELILPPGEHRYRLLVDGKWCSDPTARKISSNPFGDSDAVLTINEFSITQN